MPAKRKGESTELAPRAVMKCHQAERHHFLAPNLGRCRRCGFDSLVRKIPRRRGWQSTH